MKKLSETYKKLGIDFTFPIEIKNDSGNRTYYENSHGYQWRSEYDDNGYITYFENSNDYWWRCEHNSNGNMTYFENSNDYRWRREYDSNGNIIYYETSNGYKKGTPRSQSCNGKVVEIDGKKYKLKEI